MERPKTKRPTKLRVIVSFVLSSLILSFLYYIVLQPGKDGTFPLLINLGPVVLSHLIVFGAFCFADRDQNKYRSRFPTEGTPGHPLYTTFYQDDD